MKDLLMVKRLALFFLSFFRMNFGEKKNPHIEDLTEAIITQER
jgi:hypothetical protein